MTRVLLTAVTIAAAFPAAACSSPESSEHTDRAGQAMFGTDTTTEDDAFHGFAAASARLSNNCSATMLSPFVGVTARHCLCGVTNPDDECEAAAGRFLEPYGGNLHAQRQLRLVRRPPVQKRRKSERRRCLSARFACAE